VSNSHAAEKGSLSARSPLMVYVPFVFMSPEKWIRCLVSALEVERRYPVCCHVGASRLGCFIDLLDNENFRAEFSHLPFPSG